VELGLEDGVLRPGLVLENHAEAELAGGDGEHVAIGERLVLDLAELRLGERHVGSFTN
jgi:hypothetical protein